MNTERILLHLVAEVRAGSGRAREPAIFVGNIGIPFGASGDPILDRSNPAGFDTETQRASPTTVIPASLVRGSWNHFPFPASSLS